MARQFSALISIGLVALITACGGGGGGGGSSSGSGNTPPPDTTPNAFTFAGQGDISLSSSVTSAEVTITGITAAAAVSIAGGEYSIEGGAFTSAAGTVTNNQRVRVRLTTSAQFSTGSTATLTVGGIAAAFTATTLAMDITPAAFEFAKIANASRGAWASSASTTITGINTAATVSIVNGEYSIAGGSFTSTPGTISAGQTIVVRAQAGPTYSRATRAALTVGTVTVEFEIVSELPAYLPDATAFDGTDTVYLLSNAHHMVFRWSVAESRYLDALPVGSAGSTPTHMTYSPAHQRLYFGYSTGAIRFIATTGSNQAEQAFASVPLAVGGVTAVGDYVLAQDSSGAWATHYVFSASGTRTDDAEWNHISGNTAWDPASSRFYYFSMWSPADLNYEQIDQTTGTITQAGETPYHGAYSIVGPIRVSQDGAHVLLGSGDIYARTGLTWSGSLGGPVVDARWAADNSLVALTTSGNQTVVRRLSSANLAVLEQRTFVGQALRVAGTDARMAVVVSTGTDVQIHTYVPNDDTDGDGAANTADAFPLDAAASVDTDRDGFPDAWNAGRSQGDSTTGLVLDSFPADAACWLPAHGAGGVCNYAATMPNYTPDAGQIAQHGDVVYLLSSANRRVYRWSIAGQRYLNPFVVGLDQGYSTVAPTKIAHSPTHQRLYLGYATGAIRYIDLAGTDPAERAFGNTAMGVNGLVAVGNYVLAQDASGAWATHYTFSASGAVVSQREWNYRSNDYAWDAVNSRVYYTRDDTSPNDLLYEAIDQTTGAIAPYVDSPYHGDYPIVAPIRVSTNGQSILLGSGNLYRQSDLQWTGSLGAPVTDARWFADGSIATLTTASNQTTLRRLGANNVTTLEQLTFSGTALRVVGSDARMTVVFMGANTVQFRDYVPSDDSDADGVTNTQDAFPHDPAASVDTDNDGRPDAWNPGRSQADSTTGLVIDSFPNDAACWLPAHGSGGLCNYGANIPDYVPDAVVQQGDVIYLLSSANRRVYRRSISTGQYLNPYVVGINQGYSTLAPSKMAYVPTHGRLYLGYSNGSIRSIDVNGGASAEVAFATTSNGVTGLTNAGNFLLAHDTSSYYGASFVFRANGSLASQTGGSYSQSREYAWDPVNSRVYFFRDGFSPNDLHYNVIDQTTGAVTSSGETPYHGAYGIQPPIRVSSDGQTVLLGSGDLYRRSDLRWTGALGAQIAEARWLANGSLVALTTSAGQTVLRRLDPVNQVVLEQRTFAGDALRVVGSDTQMVVLTTSGGALAFHDYVPNDDSDADGVANTVDAFPHDHAASADTDRDGYPNAWNAGRTQADSTTGLELDSFVNDSACWLVEHGSGGVCNFAATVPAFTPDEIAQNGDTVYLLSSANRRVYRRSISTGQYLNPYVVQIDRGLDVIAPNRMTYSPAQQRLYVGYPSGTIRYIDVTGGGGQTHFATVATVVGALQAAGNYLVAQDGSGAWATHYVFAASGAITAQVEWNHISLDTAWDPVSSRYYYFSMYSPSLSYEVIDQATGTITSQGSTSHYGQYGNNGPIRPSQDGAHVLIGRGDIYARTNLTWEGSLGGAVADARWLADGSLVALTTANNQTSVRRLGSTTLNVLEQRTFAGQALRVVGSDSLMAVITLDTNGVVQFHSYVPNNDSDNDGVLNTADAFPLDVAASVDTDHDGYPDAWNAGQSQSTSTTGLELDAFPSDAACWTAAHGSGGVCNYGATIPDYTPDQIANAGNVVYLLSRTNQRIYRYSMTSGQYLNPYIVGINQGFSTLAPTKIAYSAAHQRLYVSYENGAIRYFDVTAPSPAETVFVNGIGAVTALASVGNYVLAQGGGGTWGTQYFYDAAGTLTDQYDNAWYTTEFAWDPVSSRVYFNRSGVSPGDLHYEVINQATGEVTSVGETPYHGEIGAYPPVRVSPDGSRILLGSGDLIDRTTLQIVGRLAGGVTDAQWKDDVLVTLDSTDRVAILNGRTYAELRAYPYTGTPLRVVFGTTEAYLVHVLNGTTAFIRLPFYDQDGDTIPRWWEDLYNLSDTNVNDAVLDGDSDGASNATEFAHFSNPTLADSDGDGLGDNAEIATRHTDPTLPDTDGDGLTDGAEVLTHLTNPLDADSDDDGYPDGIEIQRASNPNDVSSLPTPISSFSTSFAGALDPLWQTPAGSAAPWAIDATVGRLDLRSFKAGAITANQQSIARIHSVFTAGTLSFWVHMPANGCCDTLQLVVDGVVRTYTYGNSQWEQISVPITAGVRSIEWRFVKDYYDYSNEAVWIDDVSFGP